MFVRFVTSNELIRIDSQQVYQLNHDVTPKELRMLIKYFAEGVGLVMMFTVNNCKHPLIGTLGEYMEKYLPDVSVDEKNIIIHYDMGVEIMGLMETNNGRCKRGCGANIEVDDVIVFQKKLIHYKGDIRPSVAAVNIDRLSELIRETPSLNDILTSRRIDILNGIALSTAHAWMLRVGCKFNEAKQTYYTDGHNRVDVVEYRNKYMDRKMEFAYLQPMWIDDSDVSVDRLDNDDFCQYRNKAGDLGGYLHPYMFYWIYTFERIWQS